MEVFVVAGVFDLWVCVLCVEGELCWIFVYVFNVGFQYVFFNKILKVDVDIVFDLVFFYCNVLCLGEFIVGNWCWVSDD